MAKANAKSEAELNAEKAAEIEESAKDLTAMFQVAQDLAAGVFGNKAPSEEMILGVHDRVFAYDDEDAQQQVLEELTDSMAIAKRVFKSPSPTARAVFWVYDQVYDLDEDDEGEDDHDE